MLIISLALLWFAAAFFSVAALAPSWGLFAGLVAAGIVAAVYKIFETTDNLTVGLVVTLFSIPLICIAAGIIWWGMRLFGFPGIIGD